MLTQIHECQQKYCYHQKTEALVHSVYEEEAEQIGEPLKYSVVEQTAFKDEEKTSDHYVEGFHRTESKAENGKPRRQPDAPYGRNDMTSCDSTPDQEPLMPRSTENSFPKLLKRPSSKRDPTTANDQIPEGQQFLNVQENDAFAQSTGSTRRGTYPSSSSDHTPPFSGSMSSQPITAFQGRRGHELVEDPFSSQHLQATETQLEKVSHSHFATQQPFLTSMPLDLDPSNAARLSSTLLQVNRMPTVTMSASPLVMGSVPQASDFGSSHVFGAGDGTNARQSHHVHAHQFYGVGQFVSMVNAHPVNPGERPNSIPQATAHSLRIAVPGMFPLTYGVLGKGVFDHGMCAGHVNQTRFPTNVYSSQPEPITSPHVRASEIPSNHGFLQLGPRTEVRHAERSTTIRKVHQTSILHVRERKEEVDDHISAAPLKVSHATTSGRIVKNAGSSHRIGGQEQPVSNDPRILCSRFQVSGQTISPNQAVPLTHNYRNAYVKFQTEKLFSC
ncbi:hypothetical protein FGB62_33g010 [Gracilaria domingensis]|nr:hypothetical protein FGB62_33g010 [Gracilaria domingensis]